MTRTVPAVVALACVVGCFSESDAEDDDTSTPTGTGSDATAGTTTATSDPTGGVVDGSGEGTTTAADATDGATTDTGEPACAWALQWPATTDKDIVLVIVDAMGRGQFGLANGNAGMFYAAVSALAAPDDVHVAGVIPCPPTGSGCPAEGDGYFFTSDPQTLGTPPDQIEPMQFAADADPPAGFWRDDAPDHYLVVSEAETEWVTQRMTTAEGPLSSSQLHTRAVSSADCANFENLSALGAVPGNSSVCSLGYTFETIFDGAVLDPQPACVLPPMGGGLPAGVQELTLQLTDGNETLSPPGPVPDCADQPEGWRLVSASDGPVQLCPALCRAVAPWVVDGLEAEVTHTCP